MNVHEISDVPKCTVQYQFCIDILTANIGSRCVRVCVHLATCSGIYFAHSVNIISAISYSRNTNLHDKCSWCVSFFFFEDTTTREFCILLLNIGSCACSCVAPSSTTVYRRIKLTSFFFIIFRCLLFARIGSCVRVLV